MDIPIRSSSNHDAKAGDDAGPGSGLLPPRRDQGASYGSEAESSHDSLYAHPMLYEALRGPTTEQIASLSRILETHLGRQPSSVVDPACGPGSWLEPFGRRSTFLAGNDLSPAMVAAARQRLPRVQSEITEGDMRRLEFRNGPFDAAFEMSGALGVLLDVPNMVSVLQSLGRVLRQGGIALLNVYFCESPSAGCVPRVCWSSGPVDLASGQRASVIYEILREDLEAGLEWVRRSVLVESPVEHPLLIRDEYRIRTWRPEEWSVILARVPAFRLEAVYREDGSSWRRSRRDDLIGERLLLLRRMPTGDHSPGGDAT